MGDRWRLSTVARSSPKGGAGGGVDQGLGLGTRQKNQGNGLQGLL
jgi:hypothetical protein